MNKVPPALEKPVTKFFHSRGMVEFDRRWWDAFVKNPRIVKHYEDWARLKDGKTNTLDEGLPWYTFEAIDWLKTYLRPDMKVFEWGSGGSTLFYANQVSEVISIEHDAIWSRDVVKKLRKEKLKHVTAILIEPNKTSIKLSSGQPGDYRATNASFNNLDFKQYCTVIRKYPDSYFDLVAVDGRARPSCILEGLSKVKPRGYLLLDNSDRDFYRPGTELLRGWKRTDFPGPLPYIADFLQTSIFKKP